MIPLGSGDHQVIGSALQGKIPLRYARRRRGTERSPPSATKPWSEPRLTAFRGSGNQRRLSRIIHTSGKGVRAGSTPSPLSLYRLREPSSKPFPWDPDLVVN